MRAGGNLILLHMGKINAGQGKMLPVVPWLALMMSAFMAGCSAGSGPNDGRLQASFRISPGAPGVGQETQFTDTSTGNPTSWTWAFGDGATSTEKNPRHAYSSVGMKTVTMTVGKGTETSRTDRSIAVVTATTIMVDHHATKLTDIPSSWINQAKQVLKIAYGGVSHASQISFGMAGLVTWAHGGPLYEFNTGGTGGALDFRAYIGNFGGLGIANSLEFDVNSVTNRTAWYQATIAYLAAHPDTNVVWWMWCYGINDTQASMDLYLSQMELLEAAYPQVKFVYATGRTRAAGYFQNQTQDEVMNAYIRAYCVSHGKILYDFNDIEKYDPDGAYYGDKDVDENCDYDANGDRVKESNWAIAWQAAHPGEWYSCQSPHSQPLNANIKAFAAWHMIARLAGWDGR